MRIARFLFVACSGWSVLPAQTFVTLSPTTSPPAGQPGVTSINVTGSNFPSGSMLPASTNVTLNPASGTGVSAVAIATAVTSIVGTTRRVAFTIPSSIGVSVPTAYLVSISGTTATGAAFASSNQAALTINPGAAISSPNPNAGQQGQQNLLVTITGQLTNFVQGVTQASFGAGISVGGAPAGTFGPVNVTSATAARAQLVLNASASVGPRDVTVATGLQQATLPNGFTVTPATPAVLFGRRTDPSFATYTDSPTLSQQQWMQQHFWRMVVYSPYFDTRTSWYPNGFVYIDSYAIYTDSALVTQHPEWILKDANGNRLYIPSGCSNGTCPQYAADTSNPLYRQWWINQAAAIVLKGYKGIFVDDVNMNFSVSDGYGNLVDPIDPNTGTLMTWDKWRYYMASFMQQIRSAFPSIEIVHNSVWFAGPDGVRDQDPYIQQQIAAANYQNIEFGVNDSGLTGGTGIWSLNSLLGYIDRLHAVNRAAIISGIPLDTTSREYALANYFAVSAGADGMDDTVTTPDNWWAGFDVNLGSPLSARTTWNGLLRRDFTGGMVLVNPPQSPAVTVTLPGTYKRVDGTQVNSLTLQASQGAVLLSTSTPPVVSLSLANSASVSGTTNVTVTVSNSVSVTSVGFYVDNSLVFTSTASPYAFAWNTAIYANGSHTIRAVAHDAAGNTGTASVSVMVVNTTPTSLAALRSPGRQTDRRFRMAPRSPFTPLLRMLSQSHSTWMGGRWGTRRCGEARSPTTARRGTPVTGIPYADRSSPGRERRHRDFASRASAGTVRAAAIGR